MQRQDLPVRKPDPKRARIWIGFDDMLGDAVTLTTGVVRMMVVGSKNNYVMTMMPTFNIAANASSNFR